MHCDYHEAGRCLSCTRLGEAYAEQLASKDARVRALLAGHPDSREVDWLPPHPSPEEQLRAKAKMVVAGTPAAPTLGILDLQRQGVDLRSCRLLGPATRAALPILADFIGRASLRPYDVPRRTGELKHLHVLESTTGDLMVRFVLRSSGQIGRIRRHLPDLQAALPQLRVVSVNLLPGHVALPEGDEEVLLTTESMLAVPVGDVTVHVPPGAFIQTNSAVAGALYRTAAAWAADADPRTVLDLYCGVGGFALHLAAPGREVTGVESSAAAIAGACRSADLLRTSLDGQADAATGLRFTCADAMTYAEQLPSSPELVVVNPPRRGLGASLTTWLEQHGPEHVIYSSCNPVTLARDLAAMPSLRPMRAQLFDIFPHTDHAEVLTLLRRR